MPAGRAENGGFGYMRFFDVFNKQYLKRTLITLGSGVLALGIIFYISYHLTDSFENPLGLQNAVFVVVSVLRIKNVIMLSRQLTKSTLIFKQEESYAII